MKDLGVLVASGAGRSMNSFIEAYDPAEFVIAAPSSGRSVKVQSTWVHQVAIHNLAPFVRERLG